MEVVKSENSQLKWLTLFHTCVVCSWCRYFTDLTWFKRFFNPGSLSINSRPLQYTSISCRDGVVFWLGTYEKEGAYLKTKIICQINTLLSWIRLLCVAENRFFFRICHLHSTCYKFRMADDERRQHVSLQRVEGSRSKKCKFETLLQLKNQSFSLWVVEKPVRCLLKSLSVVKVRAIRFNVYNRTIRIFNTRFNALL